MFIVTLRGWYLRGTTWTGDLARANHFDSREAAQTSLDNAKKFMKARDYRTAQIILA